MSLQGPIKIIENEEREAERMLQEMADVEVIEPSSSPWTSPVVLF